MLNLVVSPVFLIFLFVVFGCLLRRFRIAHVWGGRSFGCGIVLLFILSLGVVKNGLVFLLESQYAYPDQAALQTIDAVVVLGGGIKPKQGLRRQTELDGFTLARTIKGIEVFKDSRAEYLVFSGGAFAPRTETEASKMKEIALHMGVMRDKILIDSLSVNTRQHPINLEPLLKARDVRNIGVVTSALHMPRALHEFKKIYPTALPIPCDYLFGGWGWHISMLIPSAGSLYHNSMVIHEVFGSIWYGCLDIVGW